jgi:putative DNA primase/helicase
VRCVSTVGWCDDAFVMPDRQFGGSEEVVLQVEGVAPAFTIAGSLDSWQRDIAVPCVGNSRLEFAISAAFTGPLLHLAGEESGGIHFWGRSSIGKTTALHVARSVWGTPLGSWRTTDNSAEAIAAGACDTLLTLDEISQAHPRVVGELAYMLGNQRGKGRMNRNATLRETHRWRVIFLSTGEVGMATRLLEGGGIARAGQEVRVLEIPADAGQGIGVFEDLRGCRGAADLAEHLRLAADRDCGHAAREFLAQLTKKTQEVAPIVHKRRRDFIAEHCPTDADGQVRRACGRFAIIAVAGELATTFGITGWNNGDATMAIVRCWHDWLAERGGAGAAEVSKALLQVRLFLEQHGESRFSLAWDKTNERPVSNRAGFRRTADTGATYYVLPQVFRCEVCKGLDAKMVARVMMERGWLLHEPDRLTTNVRIPGEGMQRVHVIPPEFLSGDQQT